ncbi:MAG: metallophosphoesterase [Candidatus Bathyarchaeia archaeon]
MSSKAKNKKKYFSIFFVTDVQGSERTFRKFLSAGEYYEADVVMCCGDITGKMVVPIVKGSDGVYISKLFGQEQRSTTEQELTKLEETISNTGYYPYRTDEDGKKQLQEDPKKIDELFRKLMFERLQGWMKLAEDKYRDTGIKCIMTAGNDDLPEIEPILNSSDFVVNAEHKVIRLDENHEMVTIGEVNITPWKCPRDVSEEQLRGLIDELAAKTENVQNSIFNLHAPPVGSTLDTAYKLDSSVDPPRVVTQAGQPVTMGVGSVAVREAIEKYQPLVGLHGHIHESRSIANLGRTMCINPGSEYSEGILRGVIVNLSKDKVLSYQLTSG